MAKIAYSVDGEMFDLADFGDVLNQLAEYTTEPTILGMEYEEAECSPITQKNLIDCSDIVDLIYERLGDIVGEFSDDFDIDSSVFAEVDQFLARILEEHSNLKNFYKIDKVTKKKITKEDIE